MDNITMIPNPRSEEIKAQIRELVNRIEGKKIPEQLRNPSSPTPPPPSECKGCGHVKIYNKSINKYSTCEADKIRINVILPEVDGHHHYCRRCVKCGKRALFEIKDGVKHLYNIDSKTSTHVYGICNKGEEMTDEQLNKICWALDESGNLLPVV